jgi:hypothetical protein
MFNASPRPSRRRSRPTPPGFPAIVGFKPRRRSVRPLRRTLQETGSTSRDRKDLWESCRGSTQQVCARQSEVQMSLPVRLSFGEEQSGGFSAFASAQAFLFASFIVIYLINATIAADATHSRTGRRSIGNLERPGETEAILGRAASLMFINEFNLLHLHRERQIHSACQCSLCGAIGRNQFCLGTRQWPTLRHRHRDSGPLEHWNIVFAVAKHHRC